MYALYVFGSPALMYKAEPILHRLDPSALCVLVTASYVSEKVDLTTGSRDDAIERLLAHPAVLAASPAWAPGDGGGCYLVVPVGLGNESMNAQTFVRRDIVWDGPTARMSISSTGTALDELEPAWRHARGGVRREIRRQRRRLRARARRQALNEVFAAMRAGDLGELRRRRRGEGVELTLAQRDRRIIAVTAAIILAVFAVPFVAGLIDPTARPQLTPLHLDKVTK